MSATLERIVVTKSRLPLFADFDHKKVVQTLTDPINFRQDPRFTEESIGHFLISQNVDGIHILPPFLRGVEVKFKGKVGVDGSFVLDEENPTATFINKSARKQLTLTLKRGDDPQQATVGVRPVGPKPKLATQVELEEPRSTT